MASPAQHVTEVIVTIHVTGADNRSPSAGYSATAPVRVQDKDVVVEFRHRDAKPVEKKYADWATAAYYACASAAGADLDTFELLFILDPDEQHRIQVYVPPDFQKGGRIGGPPLLQAEVQLGRHGFEVDQGAKGLWSVHRPDPRDGYSKRGYFDAAQTIRLASSDSELVDEVIKTYWGAHLQSSQYARYLTLRGDRRTMATKKAAGDGEEATAKKQTTVKAMDGTEVAVSPKQEEVLEQIKERSASGKPLGSDDERLSDPDSIAAMKLATGEHPVVVRGKFGTRWWYFSKEKDLEAAVKAAEKAAQDEKEAKAKKSTKSASSAEEAAPAGSGKKKGGALKKPSEK